MSGKINDEVNFFNDAKEFLDTQLPKDFEDNLLKYTKDKGYN